MPTWKWYASAALGWQLGFGILAYFVLGDLWGNTALVWALMLTWELGGLLAVAIHKVLPKPSEPGFRLFLLSILTGAMAHSSYYVLRWDGLTSWFRLLLLGPLGGGGTALVSGLFTSMFLEYGLKKTATSVFRVAVTSKEELGRMEATRKYVRQVVETRFAERKTDIPAELWSVVENSLDLEQLERWFEIALTAESYEIFRNAVLPSSEARTNCLATSDK